MMAMEAIQRRPVTPADLEAFLAETADLRRQKAAIVQALGDCALPRYVLYPDGRIERLDPEVPPAILDFLAMLNEQIARAAGRYGVQEP